MSNMPRFQEHERLMSRMADANGVDLDLAMQQGDLTPENFTAAVLACTGCSDPGACNQHLQDGLTEIPAFCRNGDMIARLAKDSPTLD